jgi:NhaP-type Na+/H+ or K+/H+ antiporter
MPALLALALLIRRRLPSIWSVLLVLAVVAAAAVVVLHSFTAWITGHPLAVALVLGAVVAATLAGTRRTR